MNSRIALLRPIFKIDPPTTRLARAVTKAIAEFVRVATDDAAGKIIITLPMLRRGRQLVQADVRPTLQNSGRSSEPHLHYHLQNSAQFGAGAGLPAQFLDYTADGERVARGEPIRGQTISPAPSPSP